MIKTERLEWIMEILTSQVNHWSFFPVVMTALGLFLQFSGNTAGDGPPFLLWAVCGLIPFACFLFRNYGEKFWIFVLCHGALLGVAFSASSLLPAQGTVICTACGAVYVLYSFALRLREEAAVYSDTVNPVTALGVSVVANFLFHRQKNMPDWDRYYLFVLIGVFACYLIIYYLKHYLSFLLVNKSSAGYLPAEEILHSGIGFVLPYTLVGALILLLSLNVEWLEPALRVLKGGLKLVLGFLLGLLSGGGGAEEPEFMEDAGYAPEAGILNLFPAETFWLWEVLEYVAIVLFFLLVFYGLTKALKLLVHILRERFGRNLRNGHVIAGGEAVCDVREKCNMEKDKSGGKNTGLFQRFSPLERIRRLYKKRVLSGREKDRAALNFMTARECGDALSLPDMAEIYERARYSGREATAGDVRRMKLACGGVRTGQPFSNL